MIKEERYNTEIQPSIDGTFNAIAPLNNLSQNRNLTIEIADSQDQPIGFSNNSSKAIDKSKIKHTKRRR